MWFFVKRFAAIGRRVQRLSAWKSFDKKKNRKLARWIVEYQLVHQDLIQINELFKSYIGCNLLTYFANGLTAAFVELLDIDWR